MWATGTCVLQGVCAENRSTKNVKKDGVCFCSCRASPMRVSRRPTCSRRATRVCVFVCVCRPHASCPNDEPMVTLSHTITPNNMEAHATQVDTLPQKILWKGDDFYLRGVIKTCCTIDWNHIVTAGGRKGCTNRHKDSFQLSCTTTTTTFPASCLL